MELQAGTAGTYLWSDGSQEERLLADGLGIYSLTVTNSAGCRAEDSTLVLPAPPLMATFSLVTPRCVGDMDGEIAVGSLSGGIPPYTYQLEGEAPQDIPLFEGLPAGTYSISIQDGEGCRLDTLLQLPAPGAGSGRRWAGSKLCRKGAARSCKAVPTCLTLPCNGPPLNTCPVILAWHHGQPAGYAAVSTHDHRQPGLQRYR